MKALIYIHRTLATAYRILYRGSIPTGARDMSPRPKSSGGSLACFSCPWQRKSPGRTKGRGSDVSVFQGRFVASVAALRLRCSAPSPELAALMRSAALALAEPGKPATGTNSRSLSMSWDSPITDLAFGGACSSFYRCLYSRSSTRGSCSSVNITASACLGRTGTPGLPWPKAETTAENPAGPSGPKPGVLQKLRSSLPILGAPLKHPPHECKELVLLPVFKARHGALQAQVLRDAYPGLPSS